METKETVAQMSDFLTSPSPSIPSLFHCNYSDWSPSYSIIPSIYLLAFLVGCLGNSLVLWAYLDRADGKGTGKLCCTGIFRTSQQSINSAGRVHQGSFPQKNKENCGSSSGQRLSHSSCSSNSPSIPRPSRSLTDSLIASLALADLCFLVTLPLWAVYTAMGYHWPFGQPLCQISSFLTALNMYASVFSLSMLSVERYWVLTGRRHSSHHAPQSCPSRALWILGGLWVLAGVLALPGLLLRSVREVEVDPESDYDWQLEPIHPTTDSGSIFLSCQMDYSMLIGAKLEETDRERAEMWWAATLSLKSTLIGFLLPLVILLVCYCSLAQLLSRHFGRGPRPDRRRQRRLLRVIVTLVMAFFLCWLPLHVNKTISMLLEFGFVPYSCSLDQILLTAQPYVTCLAYLNSCLNPLLYAACDSSFRKRCRGALLMLCGTSRKRQGGEEKEGKKDEGEEEERSSAFPTRTQEETAVRTEEGEEERVGGMTADITASK